MRIWGDADGDDHGTKANPKAARQARFSDSSTSSRRCVRSQDGDADHLRRAFRPWFGRLPVAQQERPGPVHLELPEDIAADDAAADIIPLTSSRFQLRPWRPSSAAATTMIMGASRPLSCWGRSEARPQAGRAFIRICTARRNSVFNTQMGKAPSCGSNLYIGTAALSERDWVHEAIDQADLIISIRPRHRGKAALPDGQNGRRFSCRGHRRRTVEQVLLPAGGDRRRCRRQPGGDRRPRGGQACPMPAHCGLREGILARLAEGSTEIGFR